MPNKLARSVASVSKLPPVVRAPALSAVMGNLVPFVGTAGLVVEELSEERAVVSVKNRRKVRNHIGGVHAAAMTLIAETASGFVVGMNVPDDKIPLAKRLGMEFKRRATGGLRAVAELTPEQRRAMAESPKGEVDVKVTVTDDSGAEPLVATMIWAWTTKRES